MAGQLWLNPLGHFKALDGSRDDGRADRNEAPLAWHQPAALGSIRLGPIEISPTELAGPLVIQRTAADFINVLCLCAATPPFDTVTAENLPALRKHLEVPDRCRTMGRFAVVVHSSQKFIKRVDEAARKKGLALERALVSYFDADSFSGNLCHPVFAKRSIYDWQREYRIAIDLKATSAKPFVFDVGSLNDICEIVESSDLGNVSADVPCA